jgi:hypothetical protein
MWGAEQDDDAAFERRLTAWWERSAIAASWWRLTCHYWSVLRLLLLLQLLLWLRLLLLLWLPVLTFNLLLLPWLRHHMQLQPRFLHVRRVTAGTRVDGSGAPQLHYRYKTAILRARNEVYARTRA